MSNQLSVFTFDGDSPVRVVEIDGAPWFVATDLAKVLEYRDAKNLVRGLAPKSKARAKVSTPGGLQNVTIIDEPGLYMTILRAKTKRAEPFQEWVTEEVLPTIRQTGIYEVNSAAVRELVADRDERIRILETTITARDNHIASLSTTLTAKEKTVQTFIADDADYSIRQTAKILQRDHHVETTERELYARLDEWGWIYRDKTGVWQPYASAVKAGRLRLKVGTAASPDGARTGSYPQLRVTPKGLLDLHGRLIGPEAVSALYDQVALFDEESTA